MSSFDKEITIPWERYLKSLYSIKSIFFKFDLYLIGFSNFHLCTSFKVVHMSSTNITLVQLYFSEIKHSDWMFQVTWQFLPNQTDYFSYSKKLATRSRLEFKFSRDLIIFKITYLNEPFPASFFSIFNCSTVSNNCVLKFCWWLVSNRGHLVSEATALPTEPQQLPINC